VTKYRHAMCSKRTNASCGQSGKDKQNDSQMRLQNVRKRWKGRELVKGLYRTERRGRVQKKNSSKAKHRGRRLGEGCIA